MSGSPRTAAEPTRPGTLARCPLSLPASPPRCRCTTPVPASGRLLALDLDPARGDVDRQAAELGQLLERLGGRHLADVAPSGGRHIYVLFAAALPWRELRDLCRAIALRVPGDRPGADGVPRRPDQPAWKQAQERRMAGASHDPVEVALAAVEHPNGPEAWNALLTEFAAELQRVVDQVRSPSVADQDGLTTWWSSSTTPASRGCPDSAAALRSSLSLPRRPAPEVGPVPLRGRSEARMAVLGRCGGPRLETGRRSRSDRLRSLEGPPGLYHRASEPSRMDRLLPTSGENPSPSRREKNVRL